MTQPSALALSVGVTGHRPNKLDHADVRRLRREVSKVFAELQQGIVDIPGKTDGTANSPPVIHVLSPLAEGADRILAETALEYGAELIALIPFARDVYVQDFDCPASRAKFVSLLDRATEVIELKGWPGNTERDLKAAYARIGALVVEWSNVLIALWDGEEASGIGGTAHIVKLAEDGHRPVLWLPTSRGGHGRNPGAPQWLLAEKVTRVNATQAFVTVARSILAQQSSIPAADHRPVTDDRF